MPGSIKSSGRSQEGGRLGGGGGGGGQGGQGGERGGQGGNPLGRGPFLSL